MNILFTAAAKIVDPVLNFMNLKFGTHIAFNIENFTGYYQGNYTNLDPNIFNPTNLDVAQWVRAFKSAGMGYATLCVKTHSGFCLYPTQYAPAGFSPYCITASVPWYQNSGNTDILRLFVNECVTQGIKPRIYYSIIDYTWEYRTGKTAATDAPGYINMIKTQLTELLTNYPEVDGLWFDGWDWPYMGAPLYTQIPYLTIYDHIVSLKPACLISVNDHNLVASPSMIKVYEITQNGGGDGYVPDGNTLPSEEVQTIRLDDKWREIASDDKTEAAYVSAYVIKNRQLLANSKNSNYMLGTMPFIDGKLSNAQYDRLLEVGIVNPYIAPIPPINLLAHYVFEDTAKDISGHNYNGVASNITFSQISKFKNKAALFNGATSKITLPTMPILYQNYSISFLLKINELNREVGILVNRDFAVNGVGWGWIWLGIDNRISFKAFSSDAGPSAEVLSDALSLDSVYHVVVTRNTTEINIYIDGLLVRSTPCSIPACINVRPTTIGSAKNGAAFIYPLSGYLDELIIDNSAAWSADYVGAVNSNYKALP